MGTSDRRKGIAMVPVVAVVCAIVAAGVCATVVAMAVSGGPAGNVPETPTSGDAPKAEDPGVFVSFGDVIANLAEDRLTRYVKVKITLQVNSDQASAIQKIMDGPQKAVFQNWLLTYLSDKQLQDVKGANAMNTLRREIQDGFNALLAAQGDYKVERVLFEEFNVQ